MVRPGTRGVCSTGALLAAAALAACSAHHKATVAVPAELRVSAVAVYPFGFRWPEPAYRSFELSQRLIDVALEGWGDRALFFGPSEFKVYRAQDDNAWAASNAVSLLPPYALSVHQAVILRPWAEKRQTSSQKELFNDKGKAVGATVMQEVTYLGHVEIIHPSTRTTVVELSGEAQVDPFGDHSDDSDPAPELTALMNQLTREALKELADAWSPPAEARELPVTYAFNPQEAMVYQEEGRPELGKLVAKMDPVEGDVLRLNRIRFANPGMTDADAAKLLKLPGGLWVRSAQGNVPFFTGDVIHLVDGKPALPQVLHRTRFVAGPVQIRVRRISGVQQEVPYP